jgi:hypothetical protein
VFLASWVLAALLSFPPIACGGRQNDPTSVVADRGAPVNFTYRTRGGVVFSSEATRGRATVVVLVTTYDLGSQLLLRRVDEALHAHKPRANAGAVVMEPPKYEVLLETYAEAMNLSFPIVLSDLPTREGRGPFGQIDYLPVLLVLDQQGRVVARHEGPVALDVILSDLKEASPEGRGD